MALFGTYRLDYQKTAKHTRELYAQFNALDRATDLLIDAEASMPIRYVGTSVGSPQYKSVIQL